MRGCVTHIAERVKQLPGTQNVSGDLAQRTVRVSFEADKVRDDETCLVSGLAVE